jgi:hypothetical protein
VRPAETVLAVKPPTDLLGSHVPQLDVSVPGGEAAQDEGLVEDSGLGLAACPALPDVLLDRVPQANGGRHVAEHGDGIAPGQAVFPNFASRCRGKFLESFEWE